MRRDGVKYKSAVDLVSNLTKEQVDEYAARASRVFKFAPGADIEDLIRRFGGRLHYQDPFDGSLDDDTIFVHGHSDFDIILSSISSPRRDRFTIAHELGHYLLHSRSGEHALVAARSGSDRAEWEANWFAAGFLMPRAEVEKVARVRSQARAVAAHFGVSEAAAQVRLKVLGL